MARRSIGGATSPRTIPRKTPRFFKGLRSCNRVNFTTYRRGDSSSFFQLHTNVVNKPLLHCTRQVMQQFPQKPGLPGWSLTVNNTKRRDINKSINGGLHNTKGGIYIEAAH